MSITYTYQIIKVDEQARTMEIIYNSPGRTPMHIGARLPYSNESVEAVIKMYAPIAYWKEQEAQVLIPQVGAGGQIVPNELPDAPGVPQIVTMRQARLALLQSGLLPQVAAAIAALTSPTKEAVQIEWEYSQTVERNRPFVLTLGAALNLTSTQLDQLFILANTL